MSTFRSPFASSTCSPGLGKIQVSLCPPSNQILTGFAYQYPLKLIAPDSHISPNGHPVTLIFLLTYGGGLVAGDRIALEVNLEENTRLILVTQGSTKIFKSPSREIISAQSLNVRIENGGSLCYLPDPTQPFAESMYEQQQIFWLDPHGGSSLCVLDWVSEGRRARGERWSLWKWKGKNEVRELPKAGMREKLLLRDAVDLTNDSLVPANGLIEKMNGMGVFGTLILYGPVFQRLGKFFTHEFKAQPRLGVKEWPEEHDEDLPSPVDLWRAARMKQEKIENVLWSVAVTKRDFTLIKFGATEVHGARRWLADMIKCEGGIEAEFGPQAMVGLR